MDDKQRKENAVKYFKMLEELTQKRKDQQEIDRRITALERDIDSLRGEFIKTLGTQVQERHIAVCLGNDKAVVLHVTKDKINIIKPE